MTTDRHTSEGRLSLTLLLLGLGTAMAALLGPLAFGVIEYHVVDEVLDQVIGGDAVGLVLVAPAALGAGLLVRRGHRAGPVLALGASGYAVYTYAQLGLGGEFAIEPGNSERFFPLFLGLVLLGGAAFVQAWGALDDQELPALTGRLRIVTLTVLFALAAFLALGLHLPGLVDVVGGPPYGVEYTQGPTVFWVVKLMDLGLVVPVAIIAAVGTLRGGRRARRLVHAVIVWGALLGSAVAGMSVVMVVNDDPSASTAGMVAFVVLALAFLGLAVRLFRPLVITASVRDRAPARAGTAG